MFSTFKTAALSAVLALGAFAAVPSAANAGDVKIGIHFGGPGYGYGYGPGYGYGHGPKHCTPGKAVHKAKMMGLKKVHVTKANWNGVTVKGKKFGKTRTIAFGKASFCPVKYAI
ncbi:MAG: hypothetical protein WBA44_07010 [Mesorhizobium sp.]